MAEVLFDNPPVQGGNPEERLTQLYHYLFDMSNKLNEALMTVTIEQMTPEAQTAIRQAEASAQKAEDQYTSLKSLIVKSAEVTRLAMDEIRTQLQSQYTAISEQFGEYQQTIDTQIAATAAGILQDYRIEERISGVETDTEEFINSINAYIYSGVLDENDTVGIAIGYNVTNGDGTLNQANKMATFTADRLTFWLNGTEAAYFSNAVFHIEHGEVTDSMKMGRFIWKVMPDGAMGLMKG